VAVIGWIVLGLISEHAANKLAGRLHRLQKVGKSLAEVWFAVRLYRHRSKTVALCILISAASHTCMMLMLHVATRATTKYAGVIALSCYLPLAREFATDRGNANLTTPIFMAHGLQDSVVPPQLGEDSRRMLEATGFKVEWHAYPMPHSLCEQEVADLRGYLKRIV
jgi:hypothetical protein